jgi:hypothetical protein
MFAKDKRNAWFVHDAWRVSVRRHNIHNAIVVETECITSEVKKRTEILEQQAFVLYWVPLCCTELDCIYQYSRSVLEI